MAIARIYQGVPLTVTQLLQLDQAASHHLARVRRAMIGDEVVIFNGQGGEYLGPIVEIDKKQVRVKLATFNPREAESPLKICLAQGIARGEKMDLIIQKAVELGVYRIQPLITERGNVRLDAAREQKRMAHWQQIVISACEQCGRNRLPVIAAPLSLPQWLSSVKQGDAAFMLTPHTTDAVRLRDLNLLADQPVTVLIGPEGGFSEQEINASLRQGMMPLCLGPRVLRTETAPLAAIAALQACFGDG